MSKQRSQILQRLASLALLLALSATAATAQGLFDSGDGKGSLSLRNPGSLLQLNITDQSANLTVTKGAFLAVADSEEIDTTKGLVKTGLIFSQKPQKNFRSNSYSLRAKTDGTSANLFSDGRAGVGAGLTYTYGISGLASGDPSPEESAITTSLRAALDDRSVPPLSKDPSQPAQREIRPLTTLQTESADKVAKYNTTLKEKTDAEAKAKEAAKVAKELAKTSPSKEALKGKEIADAKLKEAQDELKAIQDRVKGGGKDPGAMLVANSYSTRLQRFETATVRATEDEVKALKSSDPKILRSAALSAKVNLKQAQEDFQFTRSLYPETEFYKKLQPYHDALDQAMTNAIAALDSLSNSGTSTDRDNAIKTIEAIDTAHASIKKTREAFLAISTNAEWKTRTLVQRENAIHILTLQQRRGSKSKRLSKAINDLQTGQFLSRREVITLLDPYGINHKVDFDQLNFRVGFDHDRFEIADVDADGKAINSTEKSPTAVEGLLAYSIEIGNKKRYDAQGNPHSGSPILLGVAYGFGRSTNKSDLSTIKNSEAYLRSDFKEGNSRKLNADLAFKPNSAQDRLWLNLFTRNSSVRGERENRYGLGAFLTEKGNPFKTVGGISVSYSKKTKLRIDLISGFNF